MALSTQALMVSISAALVVIILSSSSSLIEAQEDFAPSPAPLSYISSTPASSPSSSTIAIKDLLSKDVKAQLARYVRGNMEITIQKIDEFSQTLRKRLDDPETSSYTKECIQQCDEVYDAAKEDITNSLTDIVSGDLYKANIDISAASTNVDTCEQCFEELVGEDPELKKFGAWVLGVTSDCLGALDKASS